MANSSIFLVICIFKKVSLMKNFLKHSNFPYLKLANRKIFNFQGTRTVYKTIQKIIKKTFDVFTISHTGI